MSRFRFAFLYKQSINTVMASLVMDGGVNNDGTICFTMKINGGFKYPVTSRNSFLRDRSLIELAQIDPIIGGNCIGNGTPALLVRWPVAGSETLHLNLSRFRDWESRGRVLSLPYQTSPAFHRITGSRLVEG
jgi:hypothetical protein